MPLKRILKPVSELTPVDLGYVLLAFHQGGRTTKVHTSQGDLYYLKHYRLRNQLSMAGHVANKHPKNNLVKKIGDQRVIVGVYAIRPSIPDKCIPGVLVGQHTATLSGNFYKGIIAEANEARRLGVYSAQGKVGRLRGLGLSLLPLYQALSGEVDFRKVIKPTSILTDPHGYVEFLEACSNPEAQKDLTRLQVEMARPNARLTRVLLKKMQYGKKDLRVPNESSLKDEEAI